MEMMIVNFSFPDDIMMNILAHLPIKSLVRFRCVCMSWFQLLTGQQSDPFFSKLHNAQLALANPDPILINIHSEVEEQFFYSFRFASDYTQIDNPLEIKEPDWYADEVPSYRDEGVRVDVYGICNGLMCVQCWKSQSDTMHIWNPVTRDNIRIPCPPYLSDESIKRNKRPVYGFGFCESTKEYKVICIIVSSSGMGAMKYDYQCYANVYTLGTNTWRTMKDVLFDVHTRHHKLCNVAVGGVLHYLAEQKSTWQKKLVSFDLERERFREILLPKDLINNPSLRVEELCGKLAIFCDVYKKEREVQIWVMNDYGVQDSWTKQFTITESQIPVQNWYLEPFGVANDGNIMMRNHDRLVLLDPKTYSIQSRQFFRLGDSSSFTYFYMWSLLSPRYITVIKPITENEDNGRESKICT